MKISLSRRTKVGLVIALSPFALLLLYALEQRLGGILGLRAYERAVARRGETLDYRQLIAPELLEPNPHAAKIEELGAWLKANENQLSEGPPSMWLESPGQTLPVTAFNEWERIDRSAGSSTNFNDWESFIPRFRQAERELKRLFTPVADTDFRPRVVLTNAFVSSGFSEVVAWNGLIRWRRLSALVHLREQDWLTAHADTLQLATILRGMQRDGPSFPSIIARARVVDLFACMTQLLAIPGHSEPTLKQLQSAWLALDFEQAGARELQMERAAMYHRLRELTVSETAREATLTLWQRDHELNPQSSQPVADWEIRKIRIPLWRWVWQEADCLAALHRWDQRSEWFELARTNGWQAVKLLTEAKPSPGWLRQMATKLFGEGKPPARSFGQLPYLFGDQMFTRTGHARFLSRSIRAQMLRNLALTALALKRFELRHARRPERLAELVPEFLAEVPRDPMDGKPLRYVNRGADFLLYSIGEDFIDHGGDPGPTDKHGSYHGIWSGRDAVWPSVVPP